MNKKVTAIVCAYNEERTISSVIKAILNCEIVGELIVVNDGSQDKTSELIRQFINDEKLLFIDLPQNMGKGYCMAEGVAKASNEIIVFVDGDLCNFSCKYIKQLVKPILNNEADMVIGHPAENRFDAMFNPFKPLAGERVVFRRDILPILDEMRESRFGVETLMNLYYRATGKIIKYVILYKLKHPIKLQKTSFINAIKDYLLEAYQIINTIYKHRELAYKVIRKYILSFTK